MYVSFNIDRGKSPELVGAFLLTRCPCSYIHGTTERNTMKQYIINIKGVIIDSEQWDNTAIYMINETNGDFDEITFNKDDIVKTINDKEHNEI